MTKWPRPPIEILSQQWEASKEQSHHERQTEKQRGETRSSLLVEWLAGVVSIRRWWWNGSRLICWLLISNLRFCSLWEPNKNCDQIRLGGRSSSNGTLFDRSKGRRKYCCQRQSRIDIKRRRRKFLFFFWFSENLSKRMKMKFLSWGIDSLGFQLSPLSLLRRWLLGYSAVPLASECC